MYLSNCTGYPMCNAEEEEEEEDIHFRIKCHVLIWISGFSGLVELINIIIDRWSQLQQIALPAAAAATRPIHTVYISSYRMYTEPHQQWMTPFVNIYTCDTVMSFELDMRFFYLFMLHQLNVAIMRCSRVCDVFVDKFPQQMEQKLRYKCCTLTLFFINK